MAAASAKAFDVLQSSVGAPPSSLSAWALAHGLSQLMLDGVFPPDERAEILKAILGPGGA